MSALGNEIDRSLSNGFWGEWFHQIQTDQQQHSDGLLQEFYAMTQKHNESIGWYAVRLDMAASKVLLQS